MVWRLNRAEPQVRETRGAVELHLDRLGRQAATDVGQETAADQRAALVADLGGEVGASRGLVVEGGEHQSGVAGLDEQAGEHGRAGTHGEAASRPGNGIGEDVAFDAELHCGLLRGNFVVGSDGCRDDTCQGTRVRADCESCHANRRVNGRKSPSFSSGCPQAGGRSMVSEIRSGYRYVGVIASVETVDNSCFRRSARSNPSAQGVCAEGVHARCALCTRPGVPAVRGARSPTTACG